MSKFDESFKEPWMFSNGHLMLSGKYTKDEALSIFKDYDGDEHLGLDDLKKDRVRFGFTPKDIEDFEDLDVSCWYSGASGKGSKEVWYVE